MPTDIPLISSPVSEVWTSWMLLALLLLAVLANVSQPGVVVSSFSTIFAKPDRSYADTQRTGIGQISLHMFHIGTLSMAYYLFAYTAGGFTITRFGVIVLFITMVYGLKVLLMWLVQYTFQLQKYCPNAETHYTNLVTVWCCAMYPLLLLMQNMGTGRGLQWLTGLTAAMFVLLVLVKWCRAYMNSPLTLLYILLSVMTLEVLPIMGAYYGVAFILRQSIIPL